LKTGRAQENRAADATDFIESELEESRKQLEAREQALRRFKEEHMGNLPQQLEANLATMQMLQREMQTVEESLLFAREKQEALARGVGRATTRTVVISAVLTLILDYILTAIML